MAIIETRKTARIMIAGTGSGCGKTTVTCGILNALVNRGVRTSAFKCGPDYIDPMFHTEITGIKSRNLDTFLLGDNNLKYLLNKNSVGNDISVIEGVMGFYDGLGNDGRHSSYSISRLTGTPVVLVVNPKGMALSIAAIINGFRDFMPENNIKGVIINSVSPGLYQMYKPMIEEKTGIRVLGFLPPMPEAVIESRHLGLVTAEEIKDIRKKLNIMAKNAEEFIDIDALMGLAQTAGAMEYNKVSVRKKYACNIAVAKDKAFCFYYEDSLELLREMGAELTYFSPLEDKSLPENIQGLILGGGYPELYAEKLSSNKTMLKSIKDTLSEGLPTYAECGGFMYLQQSISDKQNNKYPMTGVLDGNSTMCERLTRFGYTTLTAKEDNLFCKKGESINAHEFHYSDSNNNGNGFESVKPEGKRKWECIFASDTLFAGYPHIHFYGNTKFAESFLQKCCNFSKHI